MEEISLLKYSHDTFVEKYKAGEITIAMNRSFCNNLLASQGGKEHFSHSQLMAHKLWNNVTVFLIISSLAIPVLAWLDVISISAWWGIATLVGSAFVGKATQETACQFTREQLIKDERLYDAFQDIIVNSKLVPCIIKERVQ